MAWNSAAHDEAHGEDRFRLDENIRGAAIVVLGAAALVGLAWGAMMVLTSPEGWVTKAANSALAGEDAQVVSYTGAHSIED